MKKILKFIAYLLIVLILIVAFIKIFFPIYRVEPDGLNPIIDSNFVIVSRFYYKLSDPKDDDFILLNPIQGLYTKGVWISKINKMTMQYRDEIIGKIIFSF
jgi:signal peptidase I